MGVIMSAPERKPGTMLDEIARWLGGSDPVRALTNVACLIGNTLHCNACSIYLLHPTTTRLVLAGTVGLRQECVGKIQMDVDEGLTGLVVEERRPVVVLSHASAHPRFKYFPDAGEDLYESFLGVPILDRTSPIGVLVVQTFDPADFSHADVQRLSETGRMLGALVAPLRVQVLAEVSPQLADT